MSVSENIFKDSKGKALDPEKCLHPKPAKKKGWFGRYLDRMAKINEKEFGKDGPHCCH